MASLATSKTNPKRFEQFTLSGSLLSANTDYILTVRFPSSTAKIAVTTNGSGAFSGVPLVAPEAGAVTIEARPAAEHSGATTAAATLSSIVASVATA